MNLMDNGVLKVLNISRINTETRMCFEVEFEDFYGQVKVKDFTDIENIESYHWLE